MQGWEQEWVKQADYFFNQQLEPLSAGAIDDITKRKNLACLTGENGSKHFDSDSPYSSQKTGRLRTEFVGSGVIDREDVPYSVQPRDKNFVEVRNLPDIKMFSAWLNIHRKSRRFSIEDVEREFGNQAAHHWLNAESFPLKDDFLKLKKILGLPNDYDNVMTEIFLKPAEKVSVSDFGRNMRDVWNINTSPFKDAHFATFPVALVKRCLNAGNPKICL